ncbi:hypothetical protein MMC28_002588 [Mycoblastus sanguinarius]|nr:hypothetical protein [Mycoblastus sanguinarius]
MNRLPVELLRIVLSELIRNDEPIDIENFHPEESQIFSTLKSLRLCTRKLAIVTAEYIYEEVHLYFTETSHAKMVAIANHPIYNSHDHQLRIMPKEISGPLLTKEEFGLWLRGKRMLISGQNLTYINGGRYLDIPKSIKLSEKVVDRHYEQYNMLSGQQKKLFPRAESSLQAAVGRFLNLKEAVSGLYWPQRPTLYKRPTNPDENIMWTWKRDGCLEKFDMDQSTMILRTLERGQSQSGAHIDVAGLFDEFDTRMMDLPDPNDRAHVQRLMADAKRFDLMLNTFHLIELRKLLNAGKCAKFLGAMTKLETLNCSTYQHFVEPPPKFPDVFGNFTWPRLTHLELGRFFVWGDELTGLLHRHKTTMTFLSLRDILLHRTCSWYGVLIDLKGGALQEIELYHLGYGKHRRGKRSTSFLRIISMNTAVLYQRHIHCTSTCFKANRGRRTRELCSSNRESIFNPAIPMVMENKPNQGLMLDQASRPLFKRGSIREVSLQ